MSNHFTYEIDERNLRVILKDNEIAYSEEAWQKFENYIGAQEVAANSSKLANFQIPLNRNIILPITFGLIVIFFAFLLFNFVNIKNNENNASQTDPENKAIITIQDDGSDVIPSVPTKTVKQSSTENKNTATIKESVPKSIKKPIKTEFVQTKPEQINVQRLVPTTTPSVVTTAAKSSQGTVTIGGVNLEQPAKKKRRRRTGEVIETQTLPEARPNTAPEEREPEERPN